MGPNQARVKVDKMVSFCCPPLMAGRQGDVIQVGVNGVGSWEWGGVGGGSGDGEGSGLPSGEGIGGFWGSGRRTIALG